MGAFACLSLAGCRDQDFDWEAAKLVNPEYAYKVNFEKEFGVIDPNQSWDFTQGGTRANNTTNPADLNVSGVPAAPDGLYSQWNDSDPNDWYYVDMTTVANVGQKLPEGQVQRDQHKNDDNRTKGEAFTCAMPDNKFTITPIYQGGNSCTSVEVHMVVRDKNGTEKDYIIWKPEDNRIQIPTTGSCPTCNGTGQSHEVCSVCNGSGKSDTQVLSWDGNVYTINSGSYYLNESSINSRSASHYVILSVTGTDNDFLFCLDNNMFLKATQSGVSTVQSYQDASRLTNKSGLKLGDYNLYIEYHMIGSDRLKTSKTDSDNWTWSQVMTSSTTTSQYNTYKAAIQNVLKGLCDSCNGTGINQNGALTTCPACGGSKKSWKNVGSDQDGTTTGSSDNWAKPVSAIRSKTLTIDANDFPTGATIYFYSKAYKSNMTNAVTNSHYFYHSSLKAKTTDNNALAEIIQMSSKDLPDPKTFPSGSVNSDHEFMIIACESGADLDCNDVLFLIEGWPKVPTPLDSDNTGYYSLMTDTSKRYMVEDLGATQASDIDFNDVVVDFSEIIKIHHRTTYNSQGKIQSDTPDRMDGQQEVTVKALGGTKDISLYIGDPEDNKVLVFKKSTAGSVAQQEDSKIKFRTNYGGAENFSNVEAEVMYNTNTSKNGDGKYGLSDYLFTVKLGSPIQTSNLADSTFTYKTTAWQPDLNNVYVVVTDSPTYTSDGVQVVPNSSNQTIITFPANGTVPTMIAVPTTQAWNYERISVFTHDREGSKLQLQNYVQQTTTTEGN